MGARARGTVRERAVRAVVGVALAAVAACGDDNQPPTITSSPPAEATEDVLYTHQAIVADPDGPSATWALAPGHTCGGDTPAQLP